MTLCLIPESFAVIPPSPWDTPAVNNDIRANVLYLPIAHDEVKAIKIRGSDEELVDLLKINNPRIKPLGSFNTKYKNTYDGYSKVRLGVYKKLLKMLEFLPGHIGIAYFEGLRPLYKQKEYFDKIFKEILSKVHDKEIAYQETTKYVSPFIDNVPTHATGAAIDITLFSIKDKQAEMMDMGKFDVIFGPNDQQETFSENTTIEQRKNRLILFDAAAKAGLASYGFEWWHYSYGDRMWAYVTKQKKLYMALLLQKMTLYYLLIKHHIYKALVISNFRYNLGCVIISLLDY